MNNSDTIIQTLQAAVQVSPDNGPLRLHYAETLRQHGMWAEAEAEYRVALTLSDVDSGRVQLGLADSLYRQMKLEEARSQIEQLLSDGTTESPGPAYLLHAAILCEQGNIPLAIGEYIRAISGDPALADSDLARKLGLEPTQPTQPADADETQTLEQLAKVPDEPHDSTNTDQPPDADNPTDLPEEEGDLAFDSELGDELDSWMAQTHSGAWVEREEPPDLNSIYDGGYDDETGDFDFMEKPTINFTSVGGMDSVKEEISLKIIQPMLHPELYEAYGKSAGGGILLYGPPGCGKTHLAKATAGEVRANFISVGLDEILDMFIGNSERNLHEMFEVARRNTPCVLFFDEVDALGAKRSDMRQSAGRHLINQFLAELDGINANNDGILILAATNAPWHLDSAFRRPGRFDRIVFVPPPDAAARAEILRILLEGKPMDRIDYVSLGKKLKDLSGADLKAVVDIAVEAKLQEAMKKGQPSPITTRDLQKAAKRAKPTTTEWFSTARNHALYSNEGGLYDDILTYLGIRKT